MGSYRHFFYLFFSLDKQLNLSEFYKFQTKLLNTKKKIYCACQTGNVFVDCDQVTAKQSERSALLLYIQNRRDNFY